MAKEKVFLTEINFDFIDNYAEIHKLKDKDVQKLIERFLEFANKFLKKRDIQLEIIDKQFYLMYKEPIIPEYGATTTTIPLPKEKVAIQFTIDNLKLAWLAVNPYISVDDFSFDSIVENKFIFVVEMEHVEFLDQDKAEKNKKLKLFIDAIRKDLYDELGSNGVTPRFISVLTNDIIPKLEKEKVPKELVEQLELTTTIIKIYSDDLIFFDITGFGPVNIALNNKKQFIIMDPFYSRSLWAKGISNMLHPLVLENLNSKIKH